MTAQEVLDAVLTEIARRIQVLEDQRSNEYRRQRRSELIQLRIFLKQMKVEGAQ